MVHNQVESSTLKNRNISLQYQQPKKHNNLPGLSSTASSGNTNSKCSSPSQFPSAPQSSTKTYHLILCEQIVKEVIISETEFRTTSNGDPLGVLTETNAIPLSHQQQPQRSFSSGTLPRCSATSSSTVPPPTQQHQQSEPQVSTSSSALLTPEYIKTFQNKKLTKHLAWKDERRAVSFLFIITFFLF